MELRVSRRYSLALYNASVKAQMLETVISDAYVVLDILKKSHRLKLFFTSPVISPKVKTKVVAEVFQKNIGKLTLEFIYLLIKHSRENVIHIIFEDFINLTKERKGIIDVKVRTAVELDDKEKNKLISELEIFSKKKVDADFLLDKEVLGGFTVQIKDSVIDASIQNQLENLRKKFKKTNILVNK